MSIYKEYTAEQTEGILSQFLVDSWSYSKVTSFARNEKAFEMSYIFGLKGKSPAATVAGQAYHYALEAYFLSMKRGESFGIADLEIIAFNYIDEFKANWWKLQKTTPTVDECKIKATVVAKSLINNFFSEISTYLDDIAEVIDVELSGEEYITINGVDIPLPCHYVIDVCVKTKAGKVAIIDHKSKATYTDDEAIGLSIGVQAITYIKCIESRTGSDVDEVWFIENKYSQNKDKTPQLKKFKIELNHDTRRLYEALLYEPLKRMVSAVNDPDYTYMINDSDNFVDKADLYDFWARTMISEVGDFNVDESKKDLVSKRLKKIRDANTEMISPKVIKEFKQNAASFITYDLSHTNMTQEQLIEHTLRTFGIIARVAYKKEGYSSNTFLLEVSAGVQISSIYKYRLDIANALDVPNVRFSENLKLHEGKSYVSVDFSKRRDKDLFFDPTELSGKKIPLGKDNFGHTIIWDLENHSTPHVLVCGATGSGKSVSVESTIEYALLAGVDEIVILDPKYEFTRYANHANINVYNEILDIENEMGKLIIKMNDLVQSGQKQTTLIVFDEFADAVAQSRKGKELDIMEMVQIGTYKPQKDAFGFLAPAAPKMALQKTGEMKPLEENLRILLQKGRSSGFRIMAATQRASVKVITGDAKVNFPVQICFRVPKEADSRVVLDEAGAESLAGMGDGLIKSPEYNEVVRFQAFYKPKEVKTQAA